MGLLNALKTALQSVLRPQSKVGRGNPPLSKDRGRKAGLKAKKEIKDMSESLKEMQERLKRKRNKLAGKAKRRQEENDDPEEDEDEEEEETEEENEESDGIDLGEDIEVEEKPRGRKGKDTNKAQVDPNELNEGAATVAAESAPDAKELKKMEKAAAVRSKAVKTIGTGGEMSSPAYSRDGFVDKGAQGVASIEEQEKQVGEKQNAKLKLLQKILIKGVITKVNVDLTYGLFEGLEVTCQGKRFLIGASERNPGALDCSRVAK